MYSGMRKMFSYSHIHKSQPLSYEIGCKFAIMTQELFDASFDYFPCVSQLMHLQMQTFFHNVFEQELTREPRHVVVVIPWLNQFVPTPYKPTLYALFVIDHWS